MNTHEPAPEPPQIAAAEAADARRTLRHGIYWLLIALAVGSILGRIAAVQAKDGKTAMLSANDRSRWATVRALVDSGTYAIDDVIFHDDGSRNRSWYTIDLVRHRGRDGREHYYSSKPPLLPTLLAGQYWLIQQLTGATFELKPFYVMRVMLVLTNVLPMLVYFVILMRLVERYGRSDWGRVFAMACAVGGTFLTTFAVTLNNHLPAAISVLLAVWAARRIWADSACSPLYHALAGLFAALAVANELPALSFFALLGAALLWKSPGRTLVAFAPAAALVAVAFFATNYWAHHSWRPPYAHRHDGELLATVEQVSLPAEGQQMAVPEALRRQVPGQLSPRAAIDSIESGRRWTLFDPATHERFAIVRAGDGLQLRAWDDWYEYPLSYWKPERKTGVDRGEPSRAVYAFHVLIGHHGLLSLTPIWAFSIVGVGIWLLRGTPEQRALAIMIVLLTTVCLAFYLARPLEDRNYGGVTSGFRWMFWFTPLWLLALLPAADVIAGRRGWQALALVLLVVSVFSATYAAMNPWSQPWIFDYWENLGWIRY